MPEEKATKAAWPATREAPEGDAAIGETVADTGGTGPLSGFEVRLLPAFRARPPLRSWRRMPFGAPAAPRASRPDDEPLKGDQMKNVLALLLALPLSGLVLPPAARADEPTPRAEKPRSTFRLDYVLFELEGGQRSNERTYSMTVNEGSHGQLRSGSRVPIAVGEKGVQYQDVGLKISGRVLERDGDLTLDSELELSTFAIPEQASETRGNPILRTVSQSLSARPALGKPAVLSTLDDLNSRKRLQVEVTVTRLR